MRVFCPRGSRRSAAPRPRVVPRVAVVLTTCALTVTCALSLAVHARAAASLTGPPDSDDTSARSPVAANQSSASVSGGLARSTTSGYSTSATFKVPARSTVSCQRGVVTQNFRSLRSTKVQYLNSKGKVIRVTTSSAPVTGKAPATAQWRIS